jgi:hypothetical protein
VHYPTHDLQFAAVVLALWTWQHYLLVYVVHIYTNHKSLKYIFTQGDLNMRWRRWLVLIKNYDMEVHSHPGKANVVADAFSRKSHSTTYLLFASWEKNPTFEYLVTWPNTVDPHLDAKRGNHCSTRQ